jgi:hypothetical protein
MMTLGRSASVGAALMCVCLGSARAASLDKVWLAPAVTPASPIYSDPAPPGSTAEAELAARGFLREELFLSGRADVYRYDAMGEAQVERRDAPYVTRLVVVRPRDGRKFSGRVHLIAIHPMSSETPWDWLKAYALSEHDASVAVMIGGDGPSRAATRDGKPVSAPLVLKPFNPKRYAPIAWPDEDGLRWDAFAQTAQAIRQGKVLGDLKVRRLFASGWSFTGSFLRTFINEGFHDRARDRTGRPWIDGYLIGISSSSFRSGYIALNATQAVRPVGDPARTTRSIDVPVIELMSENEAVTNTGPQAPESDASDGRHRLYELPGLTHGDGLRGDARPRASSEGCPYAASDVPIDHFAHAALDNMDRWLSGGPGPPRAARLMIDPATSRALKDELGNPMGGVRPAQLDAPLALYAEPTADSGCATGGGPGGGYLAIKRLPLGVEALARLYPDGKPQFLAQFRSRLDALIAKRWLLSSDAETEWRDAQAYADKAFSER